MPPCAAYIHVPFCTHRCGYCNFTLVAGREDLVPAFLNALAAELSWLGEPQPVETIFLGGGTPTYLTGENLARLLGLVRQWHPLLSGGEYTVEANPNDITPELIARLAAAGVTRVSVGAQSFSPRKLRALERNHSPEQITLAVELTEQAGLATAVDLIFAAPEETLVEWEADLRSALALRPNHLSTYGLTWEQGTQFWNRRHKGLLATVAEELERTLYQTAITTLTAAGYGHYEVSNFALPGQRCRHNETYWLGGEYFAAGPGAARYVNGERSSNHRSTTAWIERVQAGRSPVVERERLGPRERATELLVFALRRIEGVDPAWFAATAGLTLEELCGERLAELRTHGCLEFAADRWRFTSEGLFVADAVCGQLLRI